MYREPPRRRFAGRYSYLAPHRAPRWRIAAAFILLCWVWGSAYLGIRLGLRTLPTFLLAGLRLFIAGLALICWNLARGRRPRLVHWRNAAFASVMLFLGCHGCLYWGERVVSSGMTAVLFTTVPMWMVLIEGLSPGGIHLSRRVFVGLALGSAGVIVLVGPAQLFGHGQVDLIGAGVELFGALSWAVGSIYCTRVALPRPATLAAGMELFSGGVLLLGLSLVRGEWSGFHVAAVSPVSWGALAYLIVASSMLGFTSYAWLLSVANPARVSTYAYINPIVAVLLGWAVVGETLYAREAIATVALIAAVVLILQAKSKPSPVPELDLQAAVAGVTSPPEEPA